MRFVGAPPHTPISSFVAPSITLEKWTHKKVISSSIARREKKKGNENAREHTYQQNNAAFKSHCANDNTMSSNVLTKEMVMQLHHLDSHYSAPNRGQYF